MKIETGYFPKKHLYLRNNFLAEKPGSPYNGASRADPLRIACILQAVNIVTINNMHKIVLLLLLTLVYSAFSVTGGPAIAKSENEKAEKNLSQFWQESGRHYNIAVEIGASFKKVSENELAFDNGSFLIESKGQLQIHLPMCTWQMQPRSMILVRIAEGSERLYCLLGGSSAISPENKVPLAVGEEMLILKRRPDESDPGGEFDIGVRQLHMYNLNKSSQMLIMEFSIPEAMEKEALLSQISHSRHAHDRALRERLIKAAAILNMVTTKHGPYSGH